MLGPRCEACAWWCQHRRDSRHNGLVNNQFFVCNVQSQVPGNIMMPGMMPFMLPGMMQTPFFFNAEVRSSGFVLMWCHCHQRPRQQIPRPIHFLLILVVCCLWLPIAGGFKRWTSIIPSVCPSSSSWGKVFSKLTTIHSVSFAKVIDPPSKLRAARDDSCLVGASAVSRCSAVVRSLFPLQEMPPRKKPKSVEPKAPRHPGMLPLIPLHSTLASTKGKGTT